MITKYLNNIKGFYDKRSTINTHNENNAAQMYQTLKKFNNWVKMVLITTYSPGGKRKSHQKNRALDLCCGVGGDLLKYKFVNIHHVNFVDFSSNSISILKDRMNAMNKNIYNAKLQYKTNKDKQTKIKVGFTNKKDLNNFIKNNELPFTHNMYVCDCFSDNLLNLDLGKHDLISSQFAFHYAFCNMKTLNQAFKNVSRLLKYGGYFVMTIPDSVQIKYFLMANNNKFKNKICEMTKIDDYQYNFSLNAFFEQCNEFFMNRETIKNVASNFKLKCIKSQSFIDFYNKNAYTHKKLTQQMQLNLSQMSLDEYDVVSCYYVYVFIKK